jgi:hypothetical protein
MPTTGLVATTLQPLVVQLSGSLARGAQLIAQCLHHEPTPQQMATFERELSALLREVGRRIVAWVLHPLEPACPDEALPRLWCKDQAYRRRRQHRTSIATLFGPVVVWRRLYEPLAPGRRASQRLELQVGLEAGVATPALAERLGSWAADHTQRQVLALLMYDQGTPWSCATLCKLLGSLRAGMAAHHHAAQVDQVLSCQLFAPCRERVTGAQSVLQCTPTRGIFPLTGLRRGRVPCGKECTLHKPMTMTTGRASLCA